MNKDVEQHLNELIEFYSQTDIDDIDYIKKLFIRNLKDVKNRYIKYDKPIKQRINKVLNYMNNTYDITGLRDLYNHYDNIEIILKGEDND